jgi:hypothetical protein
MTTPARRPIRTDFTIEVSGSKRRCRAPSHWPPAANLLAQEEDLLINQGNDVLSSV